MKTIVVGSDATPRSEPALEAAAELAVGMGATLHVVTACTMPVVGGGMDVVAVPDHGQIRHAASTEVEAQAEALRRRGLDVEVHVCDGSPADVLCRVAEAVRADTIVVGNRRMRGASRLLGAVASKVAHHAPCNVFIAHTT